ncbi:hypothetical protein niasHT_028289 [Heterodera trifolii]|uniref:Uncharacterized protein n=1 Tax=Heterodera trifolii TaxID=157864 RepID=A0ABD2JU97_9BILA
MNNRQRIRRQLAEKEFSDQSLFQGHQTELNQSVPFIFRARLYPYEETILAMAQNEVNIQFRYGKEFEPKSIIIITWMDTSAADEDEENESGFNGPTFASSSAETVAEMPKFLMLPGSGTSDSSQLTEKSNMGIPGEWLMRIDEEQIFLCGAGFQGIECVDSCLPTQWHLDCSRQCHCADGSACNVESGECPNGKCNPGWKGAPICNEDIDECQDESVSCPNEQPDCMNTPGAYLCLCYEYDNSTGKCMGSSGEADDENAALSSLSSQRRIPVPIPSMVLTPQLGPFLDKMSHQISTQMPIKVTRPSAPKLLLLGTEKAAPMQACCLNPRNIYKMTLGSLNMKSPGVSIKRK